MQPLCNLTPDSASVENIDIDITGRCPLRCKYCYNEKAGAGELGIMSLEVADQVVEYTARLNASHGRRVNWCFFGGEPFVAFDVVQHLVTQAEAGKLNISFSIFTNGATATLDQVAWCRAHKVLSKRSTGGCPQACQMTRPGDYLNKYHAESVLWNDYHRPRRVTLTPETSGYMMQSLRYLYGMGYWGGIDFVEDSYAEWSSNDVAIYQGQLTRLAEEFIRQFRAGHVLYQERLQNAARRMFGSPCRVQGCGAGCGLLGITWDGYVVPCHRFLREPRTSPLCGGRLSDVLAGNAASFGDTFRDAIAANQRCVETVKCRACPARFACNHGCYHVSWITAQDLITSPESRCAIMRHYADLALWVHNELRHRDMRWFDAQATRCLPIPEGA